MGGACSRVDTGIDEGRIAAAGQRAVAAELKRRRYIAAGRERFVDMMVAKFCSLDGPNCWGGAYRVGVMSRVEEERYNGDAITQLLRTTMGPGFTVITRNVTTCCDTAVMWYVTPVVPAVAQVPASTPAPVPPASESSDDTGV